jgi:RHS repeat-associated protein
LDGTVRGQNGPAIGGLPGESLLYEYDTWLRPTRLTSSQGAYVNDTLYTPTGKPMLRELGNEGKRAWQTFTYQYGSQRLSTARTSRENIAGFDRDATYTYNDAGDITAISDVSRDGTDTQCFGYDGLRRLTQAWTQPSTTCETNPSTALIGGPAPYWHAYGYDTAGNRTSEIRHATISGQTDTTRTYTYATPGDGNRLDRVTQTGGDGARTDTYAYDATGNATQRTIGGTTQNLDWGPSGELTQVTEGNATTSFVYGPDGDRLLRKDSSGTTLYLPNTELRLPAGSTTPVGTRYYTHGDQTVAMRTPIGVTYLTGDHQGTAQTAVNAVDLAATTRRTTPFGSERGTQGATWPNDKGFVGGTKDPTGLTHLGARQYDPGTGRFISVDPILDQADPQQMNGYTYANGNPVTNSDPDGKLCRTVSGYLECSNNDGIIRVPKKNSNGTWGYRVVGPKKRYVPPRWVAPSPQCGDLGFIGPCAGLPPTIPTIPYTPFMQDFLSGLNIPSSSVTGRLSFGALLIEQILAKKGIVRYLLTQDFKALKGGAQQTLLQMIDNAVAGGGTQKHAQLEMIMARQLAGISSLKGYTRVVLTVGKRAGVVGAGLTAIDGSRAQWAADKQRTDLSGTQKAARATSRGALAAAGGIAGAKGGAAIGGAIGGLFGGVGAPIGVVAGGIIGGAGGAAVGAAGGSVLGRRFFD